MNILIDTNIIIPLEPCEIADLHVNIEKALEFHKLIQASNNNIFIHPAIQYDLDRDNNTERKILRKNLLTKYQELKTPPESSEIETIIGITTKYSNDWVDNYLLAAVFANAIDCLVTEDKEIHKKARMLKIAHRVYYLEDIIQFLRNLFDISPLPPPHVEDVFLHTVNIKDKLFDSLRLDYPGFNEWFIKSQHKQRKAYIIKDENDVLTGICILKEEGMLPNGTHGKVLKLCTIKISEEHSGNRYGELLLKSVFNYVKENEYDYIYFTAYPKQDFLINFAKDFGFYSIQSQESNEEIILVKKFKYTEKEYNELSALEFHYTFGPFNLSYSNNDSFIIPIQPKWHSILFPDYESWLLAPNFSCGNGIKKAYLSNSRTTLMHSGDNIFFYRSEDMKAITTVAVVEDTFQSDSPSEIANYVGKRTVYRFSKIEELCSVNKVLAIKLRFVSFLEESVSLKQLLNNRILNGPPQSITKIQKERIPCLKEMIKI